MKKSSARARTRRRTTNSASCAETMNSSGAELALADVDNDGDIDMAVVSRRNTAVLLNNGIDGFQKVWEAEPLASVRAKLQHDFGITCVVFDPAGYRPAKKRRQSCCG